MNMVSSKDHNEFVYFCTVLQTTWVLKIINKFPKTTTPNFGNTKQYSTTVSSGMRINVHLEKN